MDENQDTQGTPQVNPAGQPDDDFLKVVAGIDSPPADNPQEIESSKPEDTKQVVPAEETPAGEAQVIEPANPQDGKKYAGKYETPEALEEAYKQAQRELQQVREENKIAREEFDKYISPYKNKQSSEAMQTTQEQPNTTPEPPTSDFGFLAWTPEEKELAQSDFYEASMLRDKRIAAQYQKMVSDMTASQKQTTLQELQRQAQQQAMIENARKQFNEQFQKSYPELLDNKFDEIRKVANQAVLEEVSKDQIKLTQAQQNPLVIIDWIAAKVNETLSKLGIDPKSPAGKPVAPPPKIETPGARNEVPKQKLSQQEQEINNMLGVVGR